MIDTNFKFTALATGWVLFMTYDLVIIGGGPGGYDCAIRAASSA